MPSGDFLDLQNNLAILAGRSSAAELDEDIALCKQVINEALLEVYRPVDGRAPEWARRTVALNFRAPLDITIGVTQGSVNVTGYNFPADTLGSVVQIGTNFYRIGHTQGNSQFVEPVTEPTGTYQATLFHICHPLPADVSEVIGGVEWQGRGLIAPMTDRETDIGYRSNTIGDYKPEYGAGFYGGVYVGSRATTYPRGDIMFYYIETDALHTGADVVRRMCIVPMPAESANIVFRAQVFPEELVNDTDRPKIVGDLITRCLLPIAREKWALLYKKYTGQNQSYLVAEADKARRILTLSAKPQKRGSGICRPGMR